MSYCRNIVSPATNRPASLGITQPSLHLPRLASVAKKARKRKEKGKGEAVAPRAHSHLAEGANNTTMRCIRLSILYIHEIQQKPGGINYYHTDGKGVLWFGSVWDFLQLELGLGPEIWPILRHFFFFLLLFSFYFFFFFCALFSSPLPRSLSLFAEEPGMHPVRSDQGVRVLSVLML